MLNLDNKNPSNTLTNKALLAFKPRQVILAQHNPKSTMTVSTLKDQNSTQKITLESKGTLHESILGYLHRNGFSKSLKRFQSEAQIQSDTWKASSLHLEDIFCKYNARNADSNKNTSKKQVLENDKPIEKDDVGPTNEENTTKKKKKKSTIENNNGEIVDKIEVVDKNTVVELETKPKKKKKTKHDEEAKIDTINELKIDDTTKKTKEKKKESIQQDNLEPSTTNENELATENAEKERKKKKRKSSNDEEVNTVKKRETENDTISRKEKKSTKKRKRSLSDVNDNENENEIENGNLSTEMTITEESKRQKTETFKEEKNKKEKNNTQETSNKLEINGEKSDAKKSTKKQRNVSDEAKTVNAFQRVKADQVEYADDKLQDNSYWAKDGADIGYGAKAQEVLGQVRGRDFRHEKTKKKRGSYRGGLIDLQSHSIKFNYSDQE